MKRNILKKVMSTILVGCLTCSLFTLPLHAETTETKINIASVETNSAHGNNPITNIKDGSTSTFWETNWSAANHSPTEDTPMVVTALLSENTYVSMIRITPRQGTNLQNGEGNGRFTKARYTYLDASGNTIGESFTQSYDSPPSQDPINLEVNQEIGGIKIEVLAAYAAGSDVTATMAELEFLLVQDITKYEIASVETNSAHGNNPITNIKDGNTSTFWETNWSEANHSPTEDTPMVVTALLSENANVSIIRITPRQGTNTYNGDANGRFEKARYTFLDASGNPIGESFTQSYDSPPSQDPIEIEVNQEIGGIKIEVLDAYAAGNDVTATMAELEFIYIEGQEQPLDTSALSTKIAEAQAIEKGNYTQASYDALQTAITTAQNALTTVTNEEEVNAAVAALQSAMDALTLEAANYDAVDAAEARANALVRENYVSLVAVDEALAAVVRGKDITEQEAVDAMAKAINDAIDALELKGANYDAVDAAEARANALVRENYVSLEAVDEALAAVVRGKDITEQEAVDAMAKAINDAIDALELKGANYDAVDAAEARANALVRENYVSLEAVDEALAAVVRGKDITEQEAVDAMAKAINDAIDALELKGANYDAVDAAEARANALVRENYVSLEAVDEALAAVVRGKDITEQEAVDAMAKAINDAIDALELKGANYDAVDAAEARANALVRENYVSLEAVDEALAAVVRGKDITEQEAVDAMAKAINDAIDALVLKGPESVSNLVANAVNYKEVNLTWDAIEGSTYTIYRKNTKTNEWIALGTTTETTYNVAGLKTGLTYEFKVEAQKEEDTYESEVVSVQTALTGEIELTITNHTNEFDLTWTGIEGATRYIIYRRINEGEWQKVLTLGKDVRNYTTKAKGVGTYEYLVKAARYDSIDRVYSNESNIVNATLGAETMVPSNVVIEETSSQTITLTWDKVDGMPYYEIYRSKDNGTYRMVKKTNTTSMTNSSLKSGSTYSYKIRAYKLVNNEKVYSEFSEVSITIQ